ncbi:hypothetical protein N7481_001085 [Penicillium waksmanii]|uniref:uncharacterized protein n=1 Tax=Penicillium waksmanii TaxID=69791 RepID=UPI002547EC97|nr:uncharacterized protein N7481_001085 [Penicillium waksmanii]KAJ6000676.1 hypothetical protein N7481_001085 [Penicillium waksmanii]
MATISQLQPLLRSLMKVTRDFVSDTLMIGGATVNDMKMGIVTGKPHGTSKWDNQDCKKYPCPVESHH